MGQLVEMPNGEVIEVEDGISSEALNRIKKQYTPTRKQLAAQGQSRKAALTPEQQEVERRAQEYKDSAWQHIPVASWLREHVGRPLGHSVFLGGDSAVRGALSAATSGVYNAVTKGDVGEIGKEYRIARDTDAKLNRDYADEAPITATAAELGGALVNPVGEGVGALRAFGKGADMLGKERAAAALTGTADRIANSGAVPRAILAGGNQGALNAVGNAASNGQEIGVDTVLNGAGVGAIAGGALGGAVHLGARGAQTLIDALPQNATRTAYSRIASLLDNGKVTPQQAEDMIVAADKMGGDAMVQDLTPGLRAQAGHISRRPSVPSSNELIERGNERIDNRRARFGEQVRRTAETPEGGTDASARAYELQASRKASGKADYAEGGALDAPLNWSDDLQKFFRDSPDADKLVRNAYTQAQRFGDEIGSIGQDGQVIPSMRAFDYLKREFDGQIGEALNKGNRTLAAGLSNQLRRLKGLIADTNPEYQKVLDTQRDLFQKQAALETGQNALKRITSEPRVLLKELNGLDDSAKQEARIGIIDALVNSDTKADPVAFFRSISRNNTQKKVLEFAFGGRGNLGRFERWVRREVRGTRADVLTAPGRQSETMRLAMADDDGAGGATNVLANALQGYAFGGLAGLTSRVSRTLQNISSGTSKFAQEEIAKILLSKGDDLVKGVEATKAYQKARDTSNRRRARLMGKAGQQLFTDIVGGG